jgi:hypothetical protein
MCGKWGKQVQVIHQLKALITLLGTNRTTSRQERRHALSLIIYAPLKKMRQIQQLELETNGLKKLIME